MKPNKSSILTLTLTLAFALIASGFAGTSNPKSCPDYKVCKSVVEAEPLFFRNQELQLDAFYAQTFGPQASGRTINTGPGGGFAVNGIFARYFGLGAENYWAANDGQADYVLGGYGILRYPVESWKVAPYALIGGGAALTGGDFGFGSLGGGLEYRVTPHVGTFVDTRWYFGAPDNAALLRTGLRLAF
jgi:hypothetical protein